MQKQQCKPGPWPGAGSIRKRIVLSSLQFVCSELFRRGPVVAASGALWRLQVLPNEDGQGKWWWLVVRFVVTTEMGTGEIGVRLRLPEWQCDQCILQWTYTAGQIRNIYNHKHYTVHISLKTKWEKTKADTWQMSNDSVKSSCRVYKALINLHLQTNHIKHMDPHIYEDHTIKILRWVVIWQLE